jgi:hypothetical protein
MPFSSELNAFLHSGLCANERNPVTHDTSDLDLQLAVMDFCAQANKFLVTVRSLAEQGIEIDARTEK